MLLAVLDTAAAAARKGARGRAGLGGRVEASRDPPGAEVVAKREGLQLQGSWYLAEVVSREP